MREKIIRIKDPNEVQYTDEHLRIFNEKRRRALEIMELFDFPSILYGSLARGDVHTKSDVDIVFLTPIETYMLDLPLEQKGYTIESRELVQANPNSVPKGHIHLAENTTLTIPLYKFSTQEEEFYRFGGAVDVDDIFSGKRVPGVSKKLLFIKPTKGGHIEHSIIGLEVEVSKKLKIHLETIYERIRVLSRRDKIGRTGVYLKAEIEPDSTFEATWKYLSERDPVLRRQKKIRKK